MKIETCIKKALLMLLLATAFSGTATAGWVDDWITQKTSSGVTYAQSNGQGMVSFGTFSARWNKGNGMAPVAGYERMSIRGGCGGIDAKMGGLWFAGLDRLVQKAQLIIENAAAIMFDMALASISEQLRSSMGWVEKVVRGANKIAVDECSAARSLVAKIGADDAIKDMFETPNRTFENAKKATSSGATGSAAEAAKVAEDTNTMPIPEDQIRNDCPAELQALLPAGNNTVSLVSRMLNNTSIPEFEDLARGMVGDLLISKNTNPGVIAGDTYETSTIQPCYDNKTMNFEGLIYGTIKKRGIAGACVEDDAAGEGFRDKIGAQMITIANKLRAQTALTAAESAFLDSLPPLVNYRLQTAARMNLISEVVPEMTDLVAIAYAYRSMDDMYRVFRHSARQYQTHLESNPNLFEKCNILALKRVGNSLLKWTNDIYKRVLAMHTFNAAKMNEYKLMLGLNAQSRDELSKARNRAKSRAIAYPLKTE